MTELFDPTLLSRIHSSRVIAVLVIDDEEDAVPLAEALLRGGVSSMEITLRTSSALPALKKIKAAVPEMLTGIGTILTPAQVRAAVDSGADFGVAPGVNRKVLEAALDIRFAFAPGVAVPSDIETALEYGSKLLKFFPAEPSGGLAYLRAISAPYAHLGVRFIPLGGLCAQHISAYLKDPLIAALGGSWIAPREFIKTKMWTKITALASESVEIIHSGE